MELGRRVLTRERRKHLFEDSEVVKSFSEHPRFALEERQLKLIVHGAELVLDNGKSRLNPLLPFTGPCGDAQSRRNAFEVRRIHAGADVRTRESAQEIASAEVVLNDCAESEDADDER